MATDNPRRMHFWPAVIWPLGATLLFLGGGYLFITKLAADQRSAEDAALRLESYARLESGELASRARSLAQTFVEERLRRRGEQAHNQHVMLRSVMDGVLRVLRAGLEKTRTTAAALRDVGDFPSGFDGLRTYLELAGQPETSADPVTTALRGCAPELAAVLPPGCSLTVVENNFEELLSLGGGSLPDSARTESMTREFTWGDGPSSRHWTLQVRLSEPDDYPAPTPADIALHLGEHLGHMKLMDTGWQGWLVERGGKAVAAFPPVQEGRRDRERPGFVSTTGEWIDNGDDRLVWLSRAEPLNGPDLAPAVAVSIARPAPPLVPAEFFRKDLRWSSFLSAFALLSLGLWIWFARAMLSSERRREPVRERERERPAAQKRAGPNAAALAAVEAAKAARLAQSGISEKAGRSAGAPRQRLVRGDSRAIPDVQGMIVADIDEAGEVHVEEVVVPRPKLVIPSGSLLRLQERHRGGRGRQGSRVLDQAKSPLLKDLAKRVRPVVVPAPEDAVRPERPSGRVTERIAAMKSPGGWDRVGDEGK